MVWRGEVWVSRGKGERDRDRLVCWNPLVERKRVKKREYGGIRFPSAGGKGKKKSLQKKEKWGGVCDKKSTKTLITKRGHALVAQGKNKGWGVPS